MRIEATCARVIIRADAENASSVIHVPDAAKKISDRGTVVSVGPGRRHIDGQIYPLTTQPGDRVIFSRVRAFPFSQDGDKLFVMDEEEILAVMRP